MALGQGGLGCSLAISMYARSRTAREKVPINQRIIHGGSVVPTTRNCEIRTFIYFHENSQRKPTINPSALHSVYGRLNHFKDIGHGNCAAGRGFARGL